MDGLPAQRRVRNPETGVNEAVEWQTYEEWAERNAPVLPLNPIEDASAELNAKFPNVRHEALKDIKRTVGIHLNEMYTPESEVAFKEELARRDPAWLKDGTIPEVRKIDGAKPNGEERLTGARLASHGIGVDFYPPYNEPEKRRADSVFRTEGNEWEIKQSKGISESNIRNIFNDVADGKTGKKAQQCDRIAIDVSWHQNNHNGLSLAIIEEKARIELDKRSNFKEFIIVGDNGYMTRVQKKESAGISLGTSQASSGLDTVYHKNLPSNQEKMENLKNQALRLDDVKTMDDLRNYMKEAHPNVRFIDAEMQKLKNVEGVKAAIAGVERVMEDFPEIKGHWSAVGSFKGPGIAGVSHKGELRFNPEYYTKLSHKDFLNKIEGAVNRGHFPKNAYGAEVVGIHEAGHLAAGALRSKMNNDWQSLLINYRDKRLESQIVNRVLDKLVSLPDSIMLGLGRDDFETSISGYATESVAETIAEAFNDWYTNGKNAKIYSREIINEILSMFGKMKI